MESSGVSHPRRICGANARELPGKQRITAERDAIRLFHGVKQGVRFLKLDHHFTIEKVQFW